VLATLYVTTLYYEFEQSFLTDIPLAYNLLSVCENTQSL